MLYLNGQYMTVNADADYTISSTTITNGICASIALLATRSGKLIINIEVIL